MTGIIDLTASPRLEVIEISSDLDSTNAPSRRSRTQENKTRRRRKAKSRSTVTARSDGASLSSTQPSRAHSPETGSKSNEPDRERHPISASTIDEPDFFFFDGVAAPVAADDNPPPEPLQPNGDDEKLLLPSHVTVFRDNELTSTQVIPSPKPSSDDGEYIEYLEYDDRKAPGLVRYFEAEGPEPSQSKQSIFKCKNCGAEGDHKTYDCPVQICLTCGARDEHSTRSCPISKTCYTCGMKGHINKTCPNRFAARAVSSDFRGGCDRCGSTEHNIKECPTLWRIYQYVNDEERILIMQSREQKKLFSIGGGGEGHIGGEMWCYNCANTGHLGDDCDELPHPATSSMEFSAFSFYNIMTGPFAELVSVGGGQGERGRNGVDRSRLPGEWDAGAPVDVGKQGKNKERERQEKRFREREDEDGDEDWFNSVRDVKKRETDQQARRGRRLKFGLLKDGSPPPSSPGGKSLLARLGDTREEEKREKVARRWDGHEYRFENSIRIRGAARDDRQGGSFTDWERPQAGAGDKAGGHRSARRGHGPRYRGGYNR